MFIVITLLIASSTTFVAANRLQHNGGKIVGGDPADIETYPYQVSLLLFGIHNCGGAIISRQYVVTAAQCTNGYPVASLSVRAGSSLRIWGPIVIPVSAVAQNPNFDTQRLDSDISVVRLLFPLIFTSAIQPIAIQSDIEPADGSTAVVTGWGFLSEGGSSPYQLQTVTIEIINRQTCRDIYGQSKITDNMICAGVMEGGKSPCERDTGGPLVVDGKLCGVVSWARGCARADYPFVFANIATLRDYIFANSDVTP